MDPRDALESLVRTLSHDGKAPLRSIETFSAFLEEDLGRELPERAAEDVKRIKGAVIRLRGLFDDLVRTARASLDASTTRLQTRPDAKNLG